MAMTKRPSWLELKAERPDTPERRVAYECARRAQAIGERISRARIARGITQAALARLTGTTRTAIDRLELGGADPRLDTLDRIGAALGLQLVVDLLPFDQPQPTGS